MLNSASISFVRSCVVGDSRPTQLCLVTDAQRDENNRVGLRHLTTGIVIARSLSLTQARVRAHTHSHETKID